jgi:hypothetical protein
MEFPLSRVPGMLTSMRLPDESGESFVKAWDEPMGVIAAKSDLLKKDS